jgi:serine protease Do
MVLVKQSTGNKPGGEDTENRMENWYKAGGRMVNVILTGILLVFIIISAWTYREHEEEYQRMAEDDRLSSDVSDVVKACAPSCVLIQTSGTEKNGANKGKPWRAAATGILWKKTEDAVYVLTNNHVAAPADKILLRFMVKGMEGALVKGRILGLDPQTDLAVIRVGADEFGDKSIDSLPTIRRGLSDDVEVGQRAILIGNALGEGMNVSCGVVSAVGRRHDGGDAFQTEVLVSDAAINHGNSGSMLVNGDGEMIGINTSKDAEDGSEGMGYYIPVDTAVRIADGMIEKAS